MPVRTILTACPDYIRRLRYCEYLGRYFCQCCHENAQAVVPGRVLRKWDFSKYYVSNFARDLLSKIAGDPLFNPSDINSGLYKKVKGLEAVRVSSGNWDCSVLMIGTLFCVVAKNDLFFLGFEDAAVSHEESL